MRELRPENPANGKPLEPVPVMASADLVQALERARAARPEWGGAPLADRAAAIGRFSELLDARCDALASTLTTEMGKPLAQSRAEIHATRDRIAFFLAETPGVLADETVHEEQGLRELISHEPLGVIANVSAWNYPYFVGLNVIVPALLTGNAVLYKPSEITSRTGLAIAELLHEAGVPEPVMAAVPGDGTTGRDLLALPVDGVFFTGSYPTGVAIARQVAASLIPVQLELGGKDPVYVCDDVDVETAAASLAEGAFYNCGQSCCAVERIYVHASVHDRFVEALHAAVTAMQVGDPTAPDTDLGPVTRRAQLDHLDRQIADALDGGARVVCGGSRLRGPGSFFAPTVLTHTSTDMKLMREETFGPVIGIQSVRDDTEAAAHMADTDYGLTAGVYTRDEPRATAILQTMNTGSVYWNCCDRVSPRLPWSGRAHSGLGTTLSHAGIRTFTHPKAWHLRAPA